MTNTELLLEIGSEAYGDLTATERAAILTTYTAAQSVQAGMAAFKLLMKKFQHTYRMGKTYEALSEKYAAYRQIYIDYTNIVSAGKITNEDLDDQITISREKFLVDADELDD